MKFDFNDCINYVETTQHIKLYPFQKEILKAFWEGKEVRVAKHLGRSILAKGLGAYITHIYKHNDYTKEPDVIFPYTCLVENNLMSDSFFKEQKHLISECAFKREYECIWDNTPKEN